MPKGLLRIVEPSVAPIPPTVESLITLRDVMIAIYQRMPGQIKDVQCEIDRRTRSHPTADYATLTQRQEEVLHHVRARLSNKEIAGLLFVSECTIKFHVSQLLAKFRVKTRGELL